MPDIGEGIAEVELVAWHVKPGDTVVEDQVLAEVMTEKASVEIPSPVAGKVTWIGGAIGTVFAVGADIVKIETAGDADPTPAKRAASVSPSPPPAPAAQVSKPATPAPAQPAARSATLTDVEPRHERPIATPSVRRRAWELGIDLAQVKPGGTAGRIMHADLDAYAKTHPGAASAMPAQPTASPATVTAAVMTTAREGEEPIPVIGLRRKIAMRMQDAKRRIPHFSYVEECDVTELEALRSALNAQHGEARGKLTLLPLLMRAITMAVVEHPSVNATFDDEKGVLTRHAPVHIGVATQTAAGLMVPVVRHAETLTLWQSAAEVARLAAAARSGRITRDELSGSTITVTSLGALGGIVTTPIINAPEVAIIGVNRIVERPVVRAGAIVPRKLMNLSSSFDHRVVDGHGAALFVQALKRLLETPALLFVV
jgi:2-oxoisovalerate dehydrogenase E2 component (dihydrolipoyl transacylase)